MSPHLGEVVAALTEDGLPEVEVYEKRGRSRRLERTYDGDLMVFSEEGGWAVRAGDQRRSFFCAGTGQPSPGGPWPQADGTALRLPHRTTVPHWKPPPDLEAPLMGENEAHSLLDGLARALREEVPGARLESAILEDGTSEAEILNSREVWARYRGRVAAIRVQASLGGEDGTAATIRLAERQAKNFSPLALARRLADRLVIAGKGRAPGRDRGEILLSPDVGSQLLWGLAPFFVGADARRRFEALRDRRGRLASDRLTLIDDGRLRGGVLEAPVDGEGVATGPAVLVDEGVFRQPLLAWWEAEGPSGWVPGCRLRPGWRSLPRTGPTHLYFKPDPQVGVGSLLSEVARGYYFIAATGPGTFDLEADRFALPVQGFAVQAGRATGPVDGALLCGGIRAFLQGVQAVARDLSFSPGGGMAGSPSLLVTGLEVRGGNKQEGHL